MELETFFEKFDLFADALDAVSRMRELVLELAVMGKLVSQSPTDEPAEVLLKRIHADEKQSTKRRSSRRKDSATDIIAPYSVPDSWTWTSLGSIADWGSGSTPPRGNHELYGGETTWLKSGELNDNRALAGSEEQVTDLAIKQGSFRLNQTGDVLFAMYGATVGKAAILAEPAVTNQAVCGCTPCAGVLNHYLFFYLVSQRQRFRNASEGGAQPNFSKDKIVTYPFPLPPHAEQKRIVAKVDELMALCDRLEAQQQEREEQASKLVRASLARFADAPTPANLEFLFHPSYAISPADLRKSILTLAVQGKLVPQDPNDEPAIENLDEIEFEKAALIEARKLRPNRVTEISQTKDLQYEVPDSWRWFRLGDVAFFQEGPGIRNWQFRTEGIKLLNVQNIVDGKLVLENTDRHISTEEFESTYRHFAVEAGDILFASSGASWGKTAWFVDPGYTVMLNTSMVRLKFYSKRCDDAFLMLFLRTEFFTTQMEIQLVGIQPNFGSTHLGRVYIPIPPLAEQRRIVAKVEQLLALVDTLEQQLAASRSAAANLLSALVAELTSSG